MDYKDFTTYLKQFPDKNGYFGEFGGVSLRTAFQIVWQLPNLFETGGFKPYRRS